MDLESRVPAATLGSSGVKRKKLRGLIMICGYGSGAHGAAAAAAAA